MPEQKVKHTLRNTTITFIVAAVIALAALFFTFTNTAADLAKWSPAPFAYLGFKDAFKLFNSFGEVTIAGAKGPSLLHMVFDFKNYHANTTPIFFYVILGIYAFTIIAIVAQFIYFGTKKQYKKFGWTLVTLFFGLVIGEILLVAEFAIGSVPGHFGDSAKAFMIKEFLTFKKVPDIFGGKGEYATGPSVFYGIMLYVSMLAVLVTLIAGLVAIILSFTNGTKTVATASVANSVNPSEAFDPENLEPNQFEENVNNLNTIGTTSPLVVQYINSYGDQTKKEAPVAQPAPVVMPAPVVETPNYVTKDDLKEVMAELISALKEEKVEEPVPEEPVVEEPVTCQCTCEPEVVEEPEEEEEVINCLVDEEGNEVEVISADDLESFINTAVSHAIEEKEKEAALREEALRDAEQTINDPEVTVGYDDVVVTAPVNHEPEVKSDEPAQPSTIVVALPADYHEEEPEVEEEPEEDLEDVKDIIAEEIKSALKDLRKEPVVAKPAPAPVAKPAPVEQPKPAPVTRPAPIARNETRGSEAAVVKGEVIKLNFLEKVSSGSKDLVRNYNSVKNLLMSFGVKDRLSNSCDTFRLHKKTLAKITTNGDAMKLYLALDPKDFMSIALPIQDVSNKSAYKDVPAEVKIKSESSLKRATELIYACMRNNGVEQLENADMAVDYVQLVRKELKKIENSKK